MNINDTLKFNGQELPVSLVWSTFKAFKKLTGHDLDALGANDDLDDFETLEALLFCALEIGHKKDGKKNPYKLEDMGDILDESYTDFLKLLADAKPKPNRAQRRQAEKKRA